MTVEIISESEAPFANLLGAGAVAILTEGASAGSVARRTPTGELVAKPATSEGSLVTKGQMDALLPLPITRTAYNQLGVRENRLYTIMPEGWVAA
jgi:hypothetical protein